MTSTTKNTMTLEQVRDWHLDVCAMYLRADNFIDACPHKDMADAINAHIAAQRDVMALGFQSKVGTWMGQCFDRLLYANMTERGDRLLEEILELLQAHGYDRNRVPTLVDYVYSRPVGEPDQEVGGVMITLAGFCHDAGLDMLSAGNRELDRITKPEIMAKIRAKQQSKNALHFDTPLPGDAHIAAQRDGDVATDGPFRAWWRMVEAQAEISDEAIPDEAIVLSFMGSAASTTVSAGNIRKMLTKAPHASMTVTDADIGVALFAWCAKSRYSNIERMRAALEAVMSKPHYEVRALYEHPASKTHAAVTDMARKLGDEYFRLCKLADRKPMPAGFWMEQLCTALETVLKGK